MFPASVPVHAAAALTVTVTASVTSQVRVQGLYRATKAPELTPFSRNVAHSAGDRTSETTTIASNVQGDVVALSVDAVTAGIKRGTVYVVVQLASYAVTLTVARGYVYEGVPLVLGQFVEPGPGGGEGKLSESSSSDVAGSTNTTVTLTAANALRRYYGFAISYNASADVATRTITPRLIAHITRVGPTGFAGALAVWEGPVLTLTASEEGIYYVYNRGSGPGIVVLNDADTVVPQSSATEPQPFPLGIGDAGVGDQSDTTLITNIGSGHANDRYNIFTFFEEWLAPP